MNEEWSGDIAQLHSSLFLMGRGRFFTMKWKKKVHKHLLKQKNMLLLPTEKSIKPD
jgi:hypothetical protein